MTSCSKCRKSDKQLFGVLTSPEKPVVAMAQLIEDGNLAESRIQIVLMMGSQDFFVENISSYHHERRSYRLVFRALLRRKEI